MYKADKIKKKTYVRQAKVIDKEVRKVVKKMQAVEVEQKYFPAQVGADTQVNYTGINGFPVLQLTAITQGVADTDRVGDTLYLKNVQLRIDLKEWSNALAVICTHGWRVIVFSWHPATTPNIQSVLNTVQTANTDSNYLAFYNHDLRQQFTIHYDKKFTSTKASSTAFNSNSIASLKIFCKIGRRVAKVNFTAGTTVSTNAVYLIIMNNDPTAFAGNSLPICNVSYRINYTDS